MEPRYPPGTAFPALAQALAIAVAVAGCGGGGGAGDGTTASAQLMDVDGVNVVLETQAPFASAPDFPARFHATVDAALRYWGGSWDTMSGRTVTLVDDDFVRCGGAHALGCMDRGDIRLTTRDPGFGTVDCLENTVLVHEIAHAIIGDPDHTDPRWMQMDAVAAELDGGVGYSSAGETPCAVHVSVWRHPLDSP